MHPFERFCKTNKQPLAGLAREMDVDFSTIYRIRNGQGPQTTRKILFWCKKHYIDPYEVFCHQQPDNLNS